MGSFMLFKRLTVIKKPKIKFTDEIRDLINVFPKENKEIIEDFFKTNGIDIKSNEEITLDIMSHIGWEKCEKLHTFFKIDAYNRYCSFFGRDRLRLLSMLMVSGEIKFTVSNDYNKNLIYIVKPNKILTKKRDSISRENYFERFSDLEEISDTLKYDLFKKLGER